MICQCFLVRHEISSSVPKSRHEWTDYRLLLKLQKQLHQYLLVDLHPDASYSVEENLVPEMVGPHQQTMLVAVSFPTPRHVQKQWYEVAARHAVAEERLV